MEDIRNNVKLTEFTVLNSASSDFPGNYPGYDDAWDFNKFKNEFQIKLIKMNKSDMEFDMIGCDASLANAFRRILIADVPTMAAEKCLVYNNTSIIQDEVLAHRLGLIPIHADPRQFRFPAARTSNRMEGEETGSAYDHENINPLEVIVFRLTVKCSRNPNALPDATDPDVMYLNTKVTTKQLTWLPIGNQEQKFGAGGIRPVDDNILIAKLRPGQELDVVIHCMKGVGCDHAKFSPVATASYRLLPKITLLQPISGDRAEQLAKCFTRGVIKLTEVDGVKRASVADARRDSGMREVFRSDELKKLVKMERVRNHFIFSVESTGALPPDVLVAEAIRILHAKCKLFINRLEKS